MNDTEMEYVAQKLIIARTKMVIACAEMSNEAKRTKSAMDQLGEGLRIALINFHKDVYYSWRTLPDRKDNLN